ncbi:hypothetical protein ILUMI_16483, partial [Ignelater luminosus]
VHLAVLHLKTITMKTIILCFLTLILLVQAKQDVSEELVEYYLRLLQEYVNKSAQWERPIDNRKLFQPNDEEAEPVDHGHYDFIIVGAGIAGSVLANRLTESGKYNVLVLEAGGHEDNFTDVPGFVPYLARSEFNWGYITIEQKNCCLGMKNSQCNYPTGRAVGGSSVINFPIYVRGNRKYFDKWGSENPGWDYKSVLPYLKKSENASLRWEDPGYHGHNGSLNVEDCRNYPEETNVFLDAAEQRGREILDYNGKNQNGYSTMQMFTKEGRRCSANKAFVKPAMKRKTLEILDHALGTKILVKDKTAYGLEFIRNRTKYIATASKEVIISGGTINSAQILMVSGIGPKQHLEELGIPVVQDLPVGETFYDQQTCPGIMFSTNISANEPDMKQYIRDYLTGSGSLTSTLGISGIGYDILKIRSKNRSIQYIFGSGPTEVASSFFLDWLEMKNETWQALSRNLSGKYMWAMFPILQEPKSKGTIRLKTKDPLDYPVLDSNLYSDDDDMERMLAAIKDIFEISKTPAFQRIDSKYVSDPLPACKHYEHLSSDYWTCAVKQLTYPIVEGVSTCRMGPKDDKSSVVDNKLKVHGIDRLRVVGAGVIPFSFSHPAPAVYMVGEKAADLIRKQYGDL